MLGGAHSQIQAIKYAKKTGYYVITCDYLPNNPGHELSDEYYDISTTDKDGVLNLAKKLKIDGIIAYASDPSAPTAAYVADKLDLPGAPYNSVMTMSEKDLFRNFLKREGFNSPNFAVYIDNNQMDVNKLKDLKFPVYVKPVDSSGSKGVTRVDDIVDLKGSIDYAMSFSRCNRVIVEEEIPSPYNQLHGDGFVYNGKLEFLALCDHHFKGEVPIGSTYPSVLDEGIKGRIIEIVSKAVGLLGFQSGAVNVEARVTKEGKIHIMEIGPRSGGNYVPQLMELGTGFDEVKAVVEASIGHAPEIEFKEKREYCFQYIMGTDKKGKFKGINFSDEIKYKVHRLFLHKEKGDLIIPYKNSASVVGVVLVKCSSAKDLQDLFENIENHVKVEVENMDYNFKNKKLLVMGGKPQGSDDIVKYAKSRGAYVIVTDYLDAESSPAKKYADECWNISTADVDALYERSKKIGIDGVVAGVHEFNISKTIDLAERLNLPFYAERKHWDICSNKDSFKNLCRKFDIPVVEEFSIDNINDVEEIKNIKYPIIIKPVDNSSARGIYICNNKEELEENYEKAISFSKSKKLLIEPYINAKEATVYYTVQNGEVILSLIADRHVKKVQENSIPLPVAFIFPSKHIETYISKLDEKVKKMIEYIGIRNGTFFIQSFVDDGDFIFYEMGFRLSGGKQYKIMEEMNGLNILEMIVNYSMTSTMTNKNLKNLINPRYNDWAFILNYIIKPGTVGRINGVEEVKKLNNIIDATVIIPEGMVLPESHKGTLRQKGLSVYGRAQSKDEMFSLINKVYDLLEIISDEGENMILDIRYMDEYIRYYENF